MACTCIQTMNRKLAEHNTLLISVLAGPKMIEKAALWTERCEGGRGAKKPVRVAATFCPFCGTRYQPEESAS